MAFASFHVPWPGTLRVAPACSVGEVLHGRRDLLDDDAVAAGLAGLRWVRDGATLVTRVDLPSFRDAISFVEAVADIAEAMDHHPDIDIRWRTVILRVSTHDRGGVTGMDLEFARRVDALGPDSRP